MSEGYNSFYGGRRGASFVIVKKYESIKEMVNCFQQGGNYKTVNYDEYVLIDTVSKNDADNGKIYRRGYEYTNNLGGAVYVGQIVGPSGMAPHTELKTIKEVKAIGTRDDFTYRRGEGSYNPTENLVPGKYKDSNGYWKYNDEIQWAYCSVRDINSHESTVHIGFKFPYTVIEIEGKSVSPYYNRSRNDENFVNQDLIKRTDDQSHPFFESFHISIPKGIKGDTFKNFRVITADTSVMGYEGRADDVSGKRKILVYDYYHFDKDEIGEPVSLYLGDYNMIKGVVLADDGTLTISYTHDNTTTYNKKLKWVKDILLDTDTGHLTIKYNHEKDAANQSTTYETDLSWVKDITVNEEGTITFDYTDKADKVLNKYIKWIKNVSLDSSNGHFVIEFNHATDKDGNSTKYEANLDWITGITMDSDGTIKIQHVNGNEDTLANKIKWIDNTILKTDGTLQINYNDNTNDIFTKQIQWITDVSLDDSGLLTIKYNNGTPDFTKNLKWPTSVTVNTGDTEGEGNQKINITYIDGTNADIGNPINYIMKTAIDNGHLICLYSDPIRRAEIVNNNKNYLFQGRNDWHDLGLIISNEGMLVGQNFNTTDNPSLNTISGAVTYLNNQYPSGLIGENLAGKIVTVGTNDDDKMFYAFDYTKTGGNYKGWYYLGQLASIASTSVVGKEDDQSIQTLLDELPPNGLWLIVEE